MNSVEISQGHQPSATSGADETVPLSGALASLAHVSSVSTCCVLGTSVLESAGLALFLPLLLPAQTVTPSGLANGLSSSALTYLLKFIDFMF